MPRANLRDRLARLERRREQLEDARLVSIVVRDPKLAADPAVREWLAGIERALTRRLMDMSLRSLERMLEPVAISREPSPWWRSGTDG